MDLLGVIEQSWWLGIPAAVLIGVFLGISPFSLPITTTAVGLGSAGAVGARGTGVKVVAAFGAGMIVVYTVVGLAASRLDQVIEGIMRPYAGIGYIVLGVLILALGLWQLIKPGGFCASCTLPSPKNPTVLGAFIAGVPGGFVNCPACAAIVTGVAGSAATQGSPLYSGAIMLALGVGHVGVLVIATWLLTRRWVLPVHRLKMLQRISGLALVMVAAYFFYQGSAQGLVPGPRLP